MDNSIHQLLFKMKLSISLLVAALATAVVGDEYICETSGGSPYLHHVDIMIADLRAQHKELCRKLDWDMCAETMRAKGSGAGVQLCGAGFHVSVLDSILLYCYRTSSH